MIAPGAAGVANWVFDPGAHGGWHTIDMYDPVRICLEQGVDVLPLSEELGLTRRSELAA